MSIEPQRIGEGITLSVRRTHLSDPALVALSAVATDELLAGHSDATEPRGLAAYRWLVRLAAEHSGAIATGILAHLNDGAVGMGVVVRNGGDALLHGVFVAPSFREIGVGRAIVREARSIAEGSMLRTLALPGDRRTKNLFEQAGMPAQLIVAG